MSEDLVIRERKIDFLVRLPLFQGVPTAAHALLNTIATEYEYPREAIIAHQGDVASQLYIVRAGQLEAFSRVGDSDYVKQATYMAGSWFDDRWLFEADIHPATVRARLAGRLIIIPAPQFLNFIKTYPSALNSMYPHLSVMAQDAITRSRFQGYLSAGVRRRVGPTAEQLATLAAERDETETAEPAAERFEPFTPNQEQVRRYAKFQLLPEELVYFETRRSWKTMSFRAAVSLVVGLFLFLIPIILLGTSGFTGTIMLVVGGISALIPLLNLGVTYLNWLNCYFLVTNKRLIRYENKILSFRTHVEKVDITKVQSVSTEKPGLIANWLNIGTAAITTASQSSVLYFDFIDRPQEVENSIKRISELNRTIDESQQRATLRRAVEGYFQVPPAYTPVNPPPAPARQGRMSRLRELFVQREVAGSIIYHKHPFGLLRPLVYPSAVAGVLVLISIGLYYLMPTLFALPVVWGTLTLLGLGTLAWLAWLVEDWRNDTYQITDRYVFDIDRLPLGLRESRKQAELSKIENVRTEQLGFLASIFNFGNVHIETAGADSNLVFENVRTPEKIQNEIFARREALRQKLSRSEDDRKQHDYAMLIDLYYQAVEQGRIPRHQALPDLEREEDAPDDEAPLVL